MEKKRMKVRVLSCLMVISLLMIPFLYAYSDQVKTTQQLNAQTLATQYGLKLSQMKFILETMRDTDLVNESILRLREYIQAMRIKRSLSSNELRELKEISLRYRVPHFDSKKKGSWDELLKRVDIIPPQLVVAQAINESNWGRSRFAEQGNNLFGMHCYQQGCGIIPLQREEGAQYEVAAYASISVSIRTYIHTLNTNAAYADLRNVRSALRQKGHELDAKQLALGLERYSERGKAYVISIQKIINHYLPLSLVTAVKNSLKK